MGSPETASAPPALRGLRVLAADDNSIPRQMLSEILQRWQRDVDMTASGDDALALLAERQNAGCRFDLFIIDWKRPCRDGLQTLRTMRSLLSASPPVVAVTTAYGLDDQMREAAGEDVGQFPAKPINARKLAKALVRAAPHAIPHHGPRAAPSHALALPAERHGLLAEDNDINREIGVALLTGGGLLVDCALNGAEACEMVAAQPETYSAILMDPQIPRMDGMTASRIIGMTHRSARLPIIAMTAHAHEEEWQRCLEAGMDAHVAKPVDPVRLIDALRERLRLRPARAASAEVPAIAGSGGCLPVFLPPFDIGSALRRVHGKPDLLRRLILSIAQGHVTVSRNSEELVGAGRLDDTFRVAHTSKGVSASIAEQLEDGIHTGQLDRLPMLLDSLDLAPSPPFSAAASLRGPQEEASLCLTLPAQRQPGVPDSAGGRRAIDTLRDQIKRRSLSARHNFDVLAQTLHLPASERAGHPLWLSLQKLNYAAASIHLNMIGAVLPPEQGLSP